MNCVNLLKNQLLKGTIILTAAGIVTRLIGFVYRIFLAGALGETGLGIYQLVFPVYSICFTLYAAGIQTAVSQMVSHETERNHPGIVKSGICLSLIVALSLSALLFRFADWTAASFLGTAGTASLLRILAFIFPFCGITSVINGYFYGISDARIPAVSQIIEQLFRVFFVMGVSFLVLSGNLSPDIAVMGLIAGELASNVYNICRLLPRMSPKQIWKSRFSLRKLLTLSLPLSGNKLVISLLSSVESVLIPAMLVRYGHSEGEALAIFGILTGVVLPFILFPGTLTNSLSVLLLPAISRAAGKEQHYAVRHTTNAALRYSILLGVFTSSLFLNFGLPLGVLVFHSENAGKLLTALSVLCPFLYVSTTLTSVINGLGKTGVTFLHTVSGLCLRLLFLVLVTPERGIYGYLLGMILSQILICILNGVYLVKKHGVQFHLMNQFVWPMVFSAGIFYLAKIAGLWLQNRSGSPLSLIAPALPASLLVFLYFFCFRLVSLNDFQLSLPGQKNKEFFLRKNRNI